MYVIEVIPMRRAIHVESLSYFSGTPYAPGTILTIPLRNKETSGVVVTSKEVSGAKTALRAATFSLKKLPEQKHPPTLSEAFMQTVHTLADFYACQPGALLHTLLPTEIREGKVQLPHTSRGVVADTPPAPEVFFGTLEERYRTYRSLVRETLAHSESVLFVAPSIAEALYAKEQLGVGIEDRVVTLTSSLGIRALRTAYEQLNDFSKTKLIITTPTHSVLERHDIAAVIIEGEHSGNYKTRTRPYLDYRTVLKAHAKYTGRRLMYGDSLIRSEEEFFRREGIYETHEEAPKLLDLGGKLSVIKMDDKPDPHTPFQLFSPKVLDAIDTTHKERGLSFLFAARRGLAPVVVCIDCGHIFRSPESGAPYSLIRITKNLSAQDAQIGNQEERWFVCGVSGQRERAADTCPDCGGWRLRERGIGIQYIHDEFTTLRPDIPTIVFDHTTANTHKRAEFLQNKFYATKGAVMIGTQMALSHLTKPVTTSVVVNMDALQATPTWHQQEETLATLFHLREQTTDTVFVQTRVDPDTLMQYGAKGSLTKFYDEELELRERFNYPPFAHFIHLTWQEKNAAESKDSEKIHDMLQDVKSTFYTGLPSTKGVTRHCLIRVPASSWPDKKLVPILRALPPFVRIVMNPDRII